MRYKNLIIFLLITLSTLACKQIPDVEPEIDFAKIEKWETVNDFIGEFWYRVKDPDSTKVDNGLGKNFLTVFTNEPSEKAEFGSPVYVNYDENSGAGNLIQTGILLYGNGDREWFTNTQKEGKYEPGEIYKVTETLKEAVDVTILYYIKTNDWPKDKKKTDLVKLIKEKEKELKKAEANTKGFEIDLSEFFNFPNDADYIIETYNNDLVTISGKTVKFKKEITEEEGITFYIKQKVRDFFDQNILDYAYVSDITYIFK